DPVVNNSIPVIGNGDVTEPQHVIDLMRLTNCSGVIIGRGALRTPWIFRQALELLQMGDNQISRQVFAPSFLYKCQMIRRHIDLLTQFAPSERHALHTMRSGLLGFRSTKLSSHHKS
ncbi:MAG: hypothetical protein EXR16_04915, partial [Bacteroidetes bacterium]|nr:hypothetical protein [Bacteroidota bacterium]